MSTALRDLLLVCLLVGGGIGSCSLPNANPPKLSVSAVASVIGG